MLKFIAICICDVCGGQLPIEKDLSKDSIGKATTAIVSELSSGGWKEKAGQHACPVCIQKFRNLDMTLIKD